MESSDIFPTGVGGVLYPPGSLSPAVLDKETFRALCPRADDLWLYWMGRRAGSVYKKTGNRNNVPVILESNQAVALWLDNGGGRMNDRYIEQLIARFGWPGASFSSPRIAGISPPGRSIDYPVRPRRMKNSRRGGL